MGSLHFIFVLFVSVAVAEPDPCLPENHITMNDTHRSTGYVIEHTLEGMCDHTLSLGWYRFVSGAGGRMPTSCVQQYHCGTRQPLWLDGIHPSPNDGVITGKACMNTGKDCCEHYMDIAIKNCNNQFMVYFLRALPDCPASYCAGNKVPCKPGTVSATGFEPGCVAVGASPTQATTTTQPSTTQRPTATTPSPYAAPPQYTDTPVLQPPEQNGHSFRFVCDVNYHGPADPTLKFEVEFTFNGQTDSNIPHRTATSSNQHIPLPGTLLAGHMGEKVGCRVQAYHDNSPDRTPWKDSNQYPAEIKLTATNHSVSEKGGNDTITVTSTIPIVCDIATGPNCCLHLMLDVNGPKNQLVVPHPCEVKLCQSDWNNQTHTASTTFTVAAAKDQINDGNHTMHLAFETIGSTGSGPYTDVFQHYTVAPIPIEVKDQPTRSCTWWGDPHYTMLNNRRFNLFSVGDFCAYRTHDNHFEMHTRTVRCNGHASCQCGLAIREGHDIIRISNCHNTRQAPRIEINGNNLRHGTNVYRSRCGRHIMVYLPSGREVKVDCGDSYHNVQVTYPATDTHLAEGMCGKMDDHHDTYYNRDGHVVAQPCGQTGHSNAFTWMTGHFQHDQHGHHHRRTAQDNCMPTAYTSAWSVPSSTSLFSNPPTTTPTSAPSSNSSTPASGDIHYCQCDSGLSNTDPARIDCTPGADVTQHAQRCGSSACQNVTASLPSFLQGSGWHRRRDIIYGDFDELDPPIDFGIDNDPANWNLTWPTPSGITEDQAAQKCVEAVSQSQLFQHCNSSTNPSFEDLHLNSLDNCMVDILFGDSFDMAESAVSSFTASCQAELAQNPANYATDANGNLILKEEFSKVCATACLDHGRCENGNCVCNPGYTGSNCQLKDGEPPHLDRLRGSPLCDINKKPCKVIYFDASHFEDSDHFACKVVSSHGETVNEKAVFVGGDRLSCTLPATTRSITDFTVSVTTDGVHYSNTMNITVYDSTCRECTESDGCSTQILPSTCLIDDKCHQNGDHKTTDASQMCNTSVSTSSWTTTDKGLYPVIIGRPTIVVGGAPDFMVTCKFQSPDHAANARFQVAWFIDEEYPFGVRVLAGDERELSHGLESFPHAAHSVSCRVSGFYDGQFRSSNTYSSFPIPMQLT